MCASADGLSSNLAITCLPKVNFPRKRARGCDKYLVSRFIANAVEILAAAENTMNAGSMPSDLTILISAEGGIHMVADSDWPLESLRQFHGSSAAYRVHPVADKVRVEGRSGSQTCQFETEKPASAARFLLNAVPGYHMTGLMLPAAA